MEYTTINQEEILRRFSEVRSLTMKLSDPLEIEDFVVQPIVDVSPLKWHLGHTTWFFESFILAKYIPGYQPYHPKFAFLFNSYYVSSGDRWARANRGQLTRPTVKEVFEYRQYVDSHLSQFLTSEETSLEILGLLELGMNHEQQHQELFLYDVKRILGDNPLYPVYKEKDNNPPVNTPSQREWLSVEGGNYEIGFEGNGFHFDNEVGRHQVFLHSYEIASSLVTNGEFVEFIEAGGYDSFQYWLSEGWDWVNNERICSPRYWQKEDNEWWHYTLSGYEKVNLNDPLCHVSYYEADAFARWKGARLPTEFEWEVACNTYSPLVPIDANFIENQHWRTIQEKGPGFLGNVWEWTSSAYSPYPFFKIAEGAIGEYNGKFMINQMVLRGGSYATSRNHIRNTYRNFFHPHLRWLFAGVRLARHS